MELREVIGRRRSTRYLLPHKPVERDKIQRMLEAARLASHWGNVGSLRAVVVFRDQASDEVLSVLASPVAGYQVRLAPVLIVWFLDTAAVDQQHERLRELVDAGALGYGPDRRHTLEEVLIPVFSPDSLERLKQPGLSELDCGQGIAQATLVAFEQGLGTCLMGTANPERIRKGLGMPESCRFLVTQTVGYPAESPAAGGQRPRQDFEKLFHENAYGTPFARDPEVVEELGRDGMLQEPAPLPWREEEIEFVRRGLGLDGNGIL